MADLTPKERLQPSLLDRLTDQAPTTDQESREERVLSPSRLKASVLRDLQWLLNTCNLASVQDLDPFPEVASSVLNYGLPDLAGKNVSGLDVLSLERELRQAILQFEPRILRRSLVIRTLIDASTMSHNAIQFIIEGELWGQPMPLQLYLKTEVDLESGEVAVFESTAVRDER
ncbi:type VI secretion system baseplate subunit TssE [Thiohalocapsa marina]|uniref:Type VI secretion system baseplate subunit TssE n=1 Tax=Thiohalocapsa marina TaxID=424902 RepID=A0A5M8FU92_9GAMM|nr:type VI secretion system baseplate subunit TssE [Thiohalocapsa marina]KAA6187370.1 type VI secretion system baseplate subunit TssE [Thiohalocapsa marina]